VVAADLAQPPDATTVPDETLARCLEKFAMSEQEYLPVLSPDQQLAGVISQRDVLDLYNREILRNEYLGVSLRSEAITETVHEQVRLPHDYIVEIVQIPAHLIGKTLRESQLRNRFNLTAIAIRRGGFHSPDELPDPNSPFHQEDYLVLVGRAEHLRRLTDISEERINESGS
jgi:Trk K+ transport system NAD-binding subunit